jgi:hypothetical protein
MKIPIVLKTEGSTVPRERLYYEVTADGIFQVRDTPLYHAVTRAAPPVPGLLPGAEALTLRFPPIPGAAVEEALAFFEEAHRRWGGEAIVIIFYAAERCEYRLVAPPQTLPGRWYAGGRWLADYAVRYDEVPRPHGFVRFGTIHSHADLAAHASGLDCEDERYEDGLHVVFGNFGTMRISVAAAFVAGGVRFAVNPADVLAEAGVPERAARRDWMARIKREDRSVRPRARWSGDAPGDDGARPAEFAESHGAHPVSAGEVAVSGDARTTIEPQAVVNGGARTTIEPQAVVNGGARTTIEPQAVVNGGARTTIEPGRR